MHVGSLLPLSSAPDTGLPSLVLPVSSIEHSHGILNELTEGGTGHTARQVLTAGRFDDVDAFLVEVCHGPINPDDAMAHSRLSHEAPQTALSISKFSRLTSATNPELSITWIDLCFVDHVDVCAVGQVLS